MGQLTNVSYLGVPENPDSEISIQHPIRKGFYHLVLPSGQLSLVRLNDVSFMSFNHETWRNMGI